MSLYDFASRIPLPTLVKLVGTEVVKGLQELQIANKPSELARILIDLQGSDIFKSKNFLKPLLYTFQPMDMERLNGYLDQKIIEDYDNYRDKLLNFNWGKNRFSEAILKFFGITDNEYLKTTDIDNAESERVVPRLSSSINEFEGSSIFIPEMYPLHSYQKATKDQIVDKLLEKDPIAKFILHMPTGSGKTKTAVEAIIDFWRVKGKRRGFIVWLVHSKELCEQAYTTFKDTWIAKGDYPIQMFKLFEKYTPDISYINEGILFVGFQKFNSLLRKPHRLALKLRDEVRLVVVDEAHKSIAPTYKKTIDFLTQSGSTRLMGLTATPGRGGQNEEVENQILSLFFRSTKITICDNNGNELPDPIKYLQENKYLAKIKRVALDSEVMFTEEENDKIRDFNLPSEILEKLSTNNKRNAKILHEIEKAVLDRKDSTLVFASNIAHGIILKILLRLRGITAECVFGSTPSASRRKYITDFKAGNLPVLINFGVLTTGFDAPNIKTLVISRPTSSIVLYSQMIGRALRGPKMGGVSETNTLIDVVDNYGNLGTEKAAFYYFDKYFYK